MGARVKRGANIRCKVEIRNFAKVPVNASDIDLVITDKNGDVIVTKHFIDIAKQATGIYYYDYTPADDAVLGTCAADWDVTYSTLHGKTTGYFITTR